MGGVVTKTPKRVNGCSIMNNEKPATSCHKCTQNATNGRRLCGRFCNDRINFVQNYVQNSAHRGILEQVVQFLSGGACGILWQFVARKNTAEMQERKICHVPHRPTFYKNKSKERREFIKNVYTRARGCAALEKSKKHGS